MFHIYEGPTTLRGDRFVVISDEEWRALPAEEQVRYQQRQGGFRTALDAVIQMLDASERSRVKDEETCKVIEQTIPANSRREMRFQNTERSGPQFATAKSAY